LEIYNEEISTPFALDWISWDMFYASFIIPRPK